MLKSDYEKKNSKKRPKTKRVTKQKDNKDELVIKNKCLNIKTVLL